MPALRGLEKRVCGFCEKTPMKTLVPQKKYLTYPVKPRQLTFGFGEELVLPGLPSIPGRIGLYGELLIQAIFGGRLHHNHVYSTSSASESFESEFCQPDVITRDGRVIEVKSIRSKADLQLKDDQIQKYFYLLLDNTNVRKYFISVVRHNLKQPQKNLAHLSDQEQVQAFSQAVIYIMLFPFSVAYPLFESPGYLHSGRQISNRYCSQGGSFEPMTRVKSPSVNDLFFAPEQFLERLFLSPEDYEFSRDYLEDLSVMADGQVSKIKSFPVLTITDKDTKKWFAHFREKHADRIEEAKTVVRDEKKAMVNSFFDNLAPPTESNEVLF